MISSPTHPPTLSASLIRCHCPSLLLTYEWKVKLGVARGLSCVPGEAVATRLNFSFKKPTHRLNQLGSNYAFLGEADDALRALAKHLGVESFLPKGLLTNVTSLSWAVHLAGTPAPVGAACPTLRVLRSV